MKKIILLIVLFLCGNANAELEGEYELLQGSSECPTDELQTLVVDKKKGERIFMFGSAKVWPMDMKDVSEVKDVTEEDCTIVWSYKKTEKRFDVKTTYSSCGSPEFNGVDVEKLILKGDKLTYEYTSKKLNLKCHYKKVVNP